MVFSKVKKYGWYYIFKNSLLFEQTEALAKNFARTFLFHLRKCLFQRPFLFSLFFPTTFEISFSKSKKIKL